MISSHSAKSGERCRRLHAFTLIELLTVVGIIGILVAIAIPVIGVARESAMAAVDASNLRQLAAACLLYSADHKEKTVPLWTPSSINPPQASMTWRAYITPYINNSSTVFSCPEDQKDKNTQLNITGSIPASYGLNFYWGILSGAARLHDYNTQLTTTRVTAIKSPSRMLMLADIGLVQNPAAPVSQWIDVAKLTSSLGYARMPNDSAFYGGGDSWDIFPRHGGMASVAFYDGHVGRVDIQKDIIPYGPGNPNCIYANQ